MQTLYIKTLAKLALELGKLAPEKFGKVCSELKMLRIFWNVWTRNRNIQLEFFFSLFLFPYFVFVTLSSTKVRKHGNKNELKKKYFHWIFLVQTFQNIFSILNIFCLTFRGLSFLITYMWISWIYRNSEIYLSACVAFPWFFIFFL